MYQVSKLNEDVNEDKIIETGRNNEITRCIRENAGGKY